MLTFNRLEAVVLRLGNFQSHDSERREDSRNWPVSLTTGKQLKRAL